MGSEARSLYVTLSANATAFKGQMVAAGTSVRQLGADVIGMTDQSERAMQRLGSGAGRAATMAAGALLLMGKAALDWESSWAGVSKTVDGSAAEMQELEDQLRGLARTLPATHDEIAAVAEAAGQLGVAREDITTFTKTMIDLGETTNLSADAAATAIAQMANVMGTAPEDISRVGAALVALGNDGASTEAQILEMAQRIAGAGAQIGLTEADILAVANAASSMGIDAEAGGSSISRIFTDMAKASAQGGADLERFADIAGMTSAQFVSAFEDDPTRAFASFTTGLDKMSKSGGDVFTALDQLGLADVRVSQALLSMAASGDLLTDSLDLGAQAWQENTALTDEAAKRYETTGAQAQVAWNQIKDAGIEAGDALLPVMAKLATGAGNVADAFGSLPGPVQDVLTGLLALTAVTGGAAWFGTKVVSSIRDTKDALHALGIQAGTTRTMLAQVATGTAFALLAAGYINDSNSIVDSMGRSREAAESTAGSVQDLADTLSASNVGKWAADLGIDVQRLAEDLYANGASGEYASRVLDQLAESSHGLGAMLNAQAGAILPFYTANADKAYDANKDLRASIDGLTESQQSQAALNQLLLGPLGDIGPAADGAASATDGLATATQQSAEAAREEADAIRDSVKAMRAKRNATLEAFDAETQWRSALRSAREQAAKTAAGIRGSSQAALENRQQLSGLAAAWNNQSAAVKNNRARFREAREAFIETAVAMGVGEDAAKRLAGKILEIPKSRVVEITADTAAANAAIRETQSRLDNMRDAHVAVNYTASGPLPPRLGLPPQVGRADGGPVVGPGGPREDRIPAMLSNGEYVINAASTSRYRPLLKAINDGTLNPAGAGGRGRQGRHLGYDDRPRGGSHTGQTIVVNHTKQVLPDRIQIVVDGKSMTAYVRREASGVLSEREQVTDRAAGTHGRMNWGGDG